MNIRDLQYLIAVDEQQHFGKAAEACFVSQPALSMQLKKLEDELGVQLFERTNKQVMTTAIGKQLVAQAKRILMEVDSLKTMAAAAQNPLAGTFKLGAFPTLAPYLFPDINPIIKKELPELTLLLVEEKTDVLIEKLRRGELDAALIALPLDTDEFAEQILFTDPFLLAVAKEHLLAKQKTISQDQLIHSELLLLEEGHCLRQQALDVCSINQAKEMQAFRATSLETLRQMVASNVGMTLIPQIAKGKDQNIRYIPFSSPVPSRTIGIVWRKQSARQACIEAIAAIIKQQYKN